MKKYILIYICHCILFAGCTSESSFKEIKNREIELPPVSSELQMKELDIHPIGLVHGCSVDSLFLLKTLEYKNSYRVFNVETCEDYGTIFHTGEGPNEFINLTTQGQYYTTPDSIMLRVCDNGKKKIRLINLTQTLAKGEAVITKEYSTKTNLYNIFAVNDTSFVGNTFDGIKWSYAKFNPVTEQITPIFDLLEFKDITFASGNTTAKKDMSLMAHAPFFFNQILFYSHDGANKFSVSLGKPVLFEDLKTKDYGNRLQYFSNIASSEEHVWILFKDPENSEPGSNSKIIVMDWDGNPLYLFDTGKQLRSIFSDFQKGTFYSIDVDEKLYKMTID